jgi:hypothetical protein
MSTSLDDLHEEDETGKSAEELAAEKAAAEEAARIAGEGKTAEELAAEKEAADKLAAEEAERNSVSGIEQFLAQYNIVGGIVTIEKEDGTPEDKHFNDLTPTEQANILLELAKSGSPSIETKYGLDEDEIGLLNMVRKSGKPVAEALNDIAQERVNQILALKDSNGIYYVKMSDDALTSKWIKDNNPDANEAEIAEELARQKASKFYEKTVKGIREQYLNSQKLEAEKNQADRARAFNEELEEDRRTIANAVLPLKSVAGFLINDDDKNAVLADLMEVNEEGDSKFMEEVFSDPVKLFKAAWLYKNAETFFDNMEKHYKKLVAQEYQKGKKDATDGFSAEPVSGTGSKVTGDGKPVPVRTEVAKSLEELHDDN